MATARCYTKSGNVEKYESECFSGDINHYPNNFISNMTGPDSNGNYSITYDGYDDGDSSNYDCYCETIYGDWRNGGGVKKTFYFKKKNSNIVIRVRVSVIGYSYGGFVAFDCSVEGEVNGFHANTADKIANNILKDNSISLSLAAVTPAGPFGNYTTSITSTGSLTLNTGANYVTGTQYYIDVDHPLYCSPSSGTYNGGNWEIRVTTIT